MQKQSAESIARALGGARRSGLDWSCRCPAHQDNKASLSIVDKNGKLLVHCHAGCAQSDVISKLKQSGLWYGSEERSAPKVEIDLPSAKTAEKLEKVKSKIVAEYPYVDENGVLLFTAIRYEPKDFRQRAPDGSWSIKGIRRVLYRLPKIVEAVKKGETIYLVEGEKDVHAAESIGLVATCNPMGADNGSGNKFLADFAEVLGGADVVVVPDQDESGKRHAEWVISTLISSARSVKVCNPKAGKDLADWIAAGAKAQDVVEGSQLVGQESAAPKIKMISIEEMAQKPKLKWLVKNLIVDRGVGVIYGPSKSGKTFLALDLLGAIAGGKATWFSQKVKKHSPIVYIGLEGQGGIPNRVEAYLRENGVPKLQFKFTELENFSIMNQGSVDDLIESIKAYGLENPVVCLDTFAQATAEIDENSSQMKEAVVALKKIRAGIDGTVIAIHHTGKNEERGMRGHSSLGGALDFALCVTKKDDERIFWSDKVKDGPDDSQFSFGIKVVELDPDDDGDSQSSCVVYEKDELSILSRMAYANTEYRKVIREFMEPGVTITGAADNLAIKRRAMQDVVEGMVKDGMLEKINPGNPKSGYKPTERAVNLMSQAGELLKTANQMTGKPVWRADVDA